MTNLLVQAHQPLSTSRLPAPTSYRLVDFDPIPSGSSLVLLAALLLGIFVGLPFLLAALLDISAWAGLGIVAGGLFFIFVVFGIVSGLANG